MANADCTSRTLEGVIRGTNFLVRGTEVDGVGLVQRFNMRFQRSLTRVYDLASPSFYMIEGASQGEIAFVNIIGPLGAPRLNCNCEPRTIFLDTGNLVCYPANTNFNATYTLLNAFPNGVTLSGESEKFVIIGGMSYLFNDIE